jgi:septum site-determining protein MinC
MVIQLPEEPSALDLIQDLQDDLRDAGEFFQRGELIIDFGTRSPDLEEISALDALLRERGIRLRTVTAGTVEHRNLLQSWGFRQPKWSFTPVERSSEY